MRSDETRPRDGHMNVLVLIIDSLRPDHVGAYGSPQVQTPNIDALAARGLRFNRAFPEAMVTIPARRSIFTSRRIFPFRNWKPNPELGTSPGWLPIDDPSRRSRPSSKRHGYWTAQVSATTRSPRLHGAVRAVPQELRPLASRSSASRASARPARTCRSTTVDDWLPPFLRDDRYVPGMRKYLANTGAGVRRGGDLRRARVQGGDRHCSTTPRRRQPFCLMVDCFDPHEPWSPPRSTSTCTATRTTRARRSASRRYGFARNFTEPQLRELHAIYAAEVTHDGPLARPLHGPLLRLGPRRRTRSSCC